MPFCKKFPGGTTKSKFTVLSNGNDPLLVEAKAKDNKIIDIYGTRNELGIPIAVTDVIISSSDDTTYYKFDQQKKLSTIITPNGTQFYFNWLSAHIAAVTVLASDGITQLTTQMNFENPPTTMAATVDKAKKRPNTPLKLTFTPSYTSSPQNQLAAASQNLLITVTQCESPADAQVYVDARTTGGSFLSRIPAFYISKGQYGASIPSNTAPTINPGETCGDIAGVLDDGCIALENPNFAATFCIYLTEAVAATVIAAPIAAEIAAGCAIAVGGLELYCSTFGVSVPGGPSLAEQLCNSPYINRTITQDIDLTPVAIGLPNNIYGFSKQAPGNGPYPNLSIDLGSKTTIRKLELNPPVPVTFQSYIALVDVFCLPTGTNVNISIVGTDGYSNSINYPISSTQGNGQFTLTVPGAATAGIKDIVTLTITLPDGTILTRQASLIFA